MELEIALGLAAAAFIVYRQFTPQAVSGRRLLLLPALLAFAGLQTMSRSAGADLGSAVLLVTSVASGLALGWWRGMTFSVYDRAGITMAQATWTTAISWAVLIVVRVATIGVAGAAGVGHGPALGEMLVGLAATFAAQNAVIWLRAASPEPTGARVF